MAVQLNRDGLDALVIRWAVVGGEGGFIGNHHDTGLYLASQLSLAGAIKDEVPIRNEIVASALSSNPEKSIAGGKKRGIARSYGNYKELLEQELNLSPEERAVAVSIRLPNSKQYDAAMAFLNAGFHVVIDKPIATTPTQAQEMAVTAEQKELVNVVTQTYAGSPMLREFSHRVMAGLLGEVNAIHTLYPQGWTIGLSPAEVWRLNPKFSGPLGVTLDLGATHCLYDAQFVMGVKGLNQITANLGVVGNKAVLDNYGQIMFKMNSLQFREVLGNGYWSQYAAGWRNTHEVRVDGDYASAVWSNNVMNGSSEVLAIYRGGRTEQISRDPNDSISSNGLNTKVLCESALRACKAPGEHGEGFDHWMGAIYRDAAEQIAGKIYGIEVSKAANNVPTLHDGAISIWNAYKILDSHLQGGIPLDANYNSSKEAALELETSVFERLHGTKLGEFFKDAGR